MIRSRIGLRDAYGSQVNYNFEELVSKGACNLAPQQVVRFEVCQFRLIDDVTAYRMCLFAVVIIALNLVGKSFCAEVPITKGRVFLNRNTRPMVGASRCTLVHTGVSIK